MENWKQFLTSPAGKSKTKTRTWWISDQGRVKITNDWNDEVKWPTLAASANNHHDGYLAISINHAPEKYVHRLVAWAFIPNPENKRCVNHIDADKRNNCVDNLEWATYKENAQHASANGLLGNRYANPTEKQLAYREYRRAYVLRQKAKRDAHRAEVEAEVRLLFKDIEPEKHRNKYWAPIAIKAARLLSQRACKLTKNNIDYILPRLDVANTPCNHKYILREVNKAVKQKLTNRV